MTFRCKLAGKMNRFTILLLHQHFLKRADEEEGNPNVVRVNKDTGMCFDPGTHS